MLQTKVLAPMAALPERMTISRWACRDRKFKCLRSRCLKVLELLSVVIFGKFYQKCMLKARSLNEELSNILMYICACSGQRKAKNDRVQRLHELSKLYSETLQIIYCCLNPKWPCGTMYPCIGHTKLKDEVGLLDVRQRQVFFACVTNPFFSAQIFFLDTSKRRSRREARNNFKNCKKEKRPIELLVLFSPFDPKFIS